MCFLDNDFPKTLNKYESVAEVPEKVKKTSCDSSGSARRLWRSGSVVGGSGGAQGGPGRALGGSGRAGRLYI